MKTLSDFKRSLKDGAVLQVRFNRGTDGGWVDRVVVKVQSNAVAFFRGETVSEDGDISKAPLPKLQELVESARTHPHRLASWHWWHKASDYKASPETPNAIRVLLGSAWEDPHSGWMEYRVKENQTNGV